MSDRTWEGFHGTRVGKRTTQTEVKAERDCGVSRGMCWPQLGYRWTIIGRIN